MCAPPRSSAIMQRRTHEHAHARRTRGYLSMHQAGEGLDTVTSGRARRVPAAARRRVATCCAVLRRAAAAGRGPRLCQEGHRAHCRHRSEVPPATSPAPTHARALCTRARAAPLAARARNRPARLGSAANSRMQSSRPPRALHCRARAALLRPRALDAPAAAGLSRGGQAATRRRRRRSARGRRCGGRLRSDADAVSVRCSVSASANSLLQVPKVSEQLRLAPRESKDFVQKNWQAVRQPTAHCLPSGPRSTACMPARKCSASPVRRRRCTRGSALRHAVMCATAQRSTAKRRLALGAPTGGLRPLRSLVVG